MFGFRSKEKDHVSAEAIIKVIHSYYSAIRKKFPNKREIFYLALTWAIYAKKHHPGQYKNNSLALLIIAGSGDTLLFSLLEPPNSIDALAYYMVNKERISIAKEYEPKFNEIMGQIKITEDQINAEKKMVDYLSDEMGKIQDITENDF